MAIDDFRRIANAIRSVAGLGDDNPVAAVRFGSDDRAFRLLLSAGGKRETQADPRGLIPEWDRALLNVDGVEFTAYGPTPWQERRNALLSVGLRAFTPPVDPEQQSDEPPGWFRVEVSCPPPRPLDFDWFRHDTGERVDIVPAGVPVYARPKSQPDSDRYHGVPAKFVNVDPPKVIAIADAASRFMAPERALELSRNIVTGLQDGHEDPATVALAAVQNRIANFGLDVHPARVNLLVAAIVEAWGRP